MRLVKAILVFEQGMFYYRKGRQHIGTIQTCKRRTGMRKCAKVLPKTSAEIEKLEWRDGVVLQTMKDLAVGRVAQ